VCADCTLRTVVELKLSALASAAELVSAMAFSSVRGGSVSEVFKTASHARNLCRDIFETIYFSALKTSCELAKIHGPYETYEGCPVSKGILQPDMWNVALKGSRWDWDGLRASIKEHGVRLQRHSIDQWV
jgi:hypothetical protein